MSLGRFVDAGIARACALGGCMLLIASAACAAPPQSVSVMEATGERVIIPGPTVKRTPVYKGQLYLDMIAKAEQQRREKEQISECLDKMESYQCWRMYGDLMSKPKALVLPALQWLAFDPLYVVLQYRLVLEDLNRLKRLGDEGLVVCLNPRVPEGYWPLINQVRPILAKTPNLKPDPSPMEVLKSKACAAFADFPA